MKNKHTDTLGSPPDIPKYKKLAPQKNKVSVLISKPQLQERPDF